MNISQCLLFLYLKLAQNVWGGTKDQKAPKHFKGKTQPTIYLKKTSNPKHSQSIVVWIFPLRCYGNAVGYDTYLFTSSSIFHQHPAIFTLFYPHFFHRPTLPFCVLLKPLSPYQKRIAVWRDLNSFATHFILYGIFVPPHRNHKRKRRMEKTGLFQHKWTQIKDEMLASDPCLVSSASLFCVCAATFLVLTHKIFASFWY